MVSSNFSPEVAKTLHELGAHDIVQMEQYMDFVRCRYFRKTLVCRNGVRLNRMLTPSVVKGLWLASNAAPAAELALDAGSAVTFSTPGGDSITCKSPLTKLALRTLGERWPVPVRFEELAAHAAAEAQRAGAGFDDAGAERFLAGEMLTCMASGVAEWRLSPAPFTTEIAAQPATTALARMEADLGYRVTSLRGESVTLDEFHRQVLRLLDGTRNRAALGEALTAMCRRGELLLHREGPEKAPVRDEAEMRELLGPALAKALENLAKKALLSRPAA
jgi:methyltransferase-like protein